MSTSDIMSFQILSPLSDMPPPSTLRSSSWLILPFPSRSNTLNAHFRFSAESSFVLFAAAIAATLSSRFRHFCRRRQLRISLRVARLWVCLLAQLLTCCSREWVLLSTTCRCCRHRAAWTPCWAVWVLLRRSGGWPCTSELPAAFSVRVWNCRGLRASFWATPSLYLLTFLPSIFRNHSWFKASFALIRVSGLKLIICLISDFALSDIVLHFGDVKSNLPLFNLHQDFVIVIAVERRLAWQQYEHDDSDAPNVSLFVIFAAEDFWSYVVRRPDNLFDYDQLLKM